MWCIHPSPSAYKPAIRQFDREPPNKYKITTLIFKQFPLDHRLGSSCFTWPMWLQTPLKLATIKTTAEAMQAATVKTAGSNQRGEKGCIFLTLPVLLGPSFRRAYKRICQNPTAGGGLYESAMFDLSRQRSVRLLQVS